MLDLRPGGRTKAACMYRVNDHDSENRSSCLKSELAEFVVGANRLISPRTYYLVNW